MEQVEYQVCDRCGYSTNEPGSKVCESCGASLEKKVTKLSVVEKKEEKKKRDFKGKPLVLLISGLVGISAALSISIDWMIESPTAAMIRAKGTISFGGEPCSRGFMLEEFAKQVNKLNPDVSFRYTDNDKNKDQIEELIEGQIQIAFSEKAYLDEHIMRARERGITLKAIPYAYDGITYITDKSTKVRPLTIKELEAIYEGRITNWKELGGEDKLIYPILMDGLWVNPMGIRLDDGLNPNVILVKGDRTRARDLLVTTNGGIFYTSATLAVEQLKKINIISIKKENGEVVSPVLTKGRTNQAAIASGDYPLVRALNVIVNSKVFEKNQETINPQVKDVKAFVRYLISPPGQGLVAKAGFVPKYAAKSPEKSWFSWR